MLGMLGITVVLLWGEKHVTGRTLPQYGCPYNQVADLTTLLIFSQTKAFRCLNLLWKSVSAGFWETTLLEGCLLT